MKTYILSILLFSACSADPPAIAEAPDAAPGAAVCSPDDPVTITVRVRPQMPVGNLISDNLPWLRVWDTTEADDPHNALALEYIHDDSRASRMGYHLQAEYPAQRGYHGALLFDPAEAWLVQPAVFTLEIPCGVDQMTYYLDTVVRPVPIRPNHATDD